ncbi:S8 family peptidase [Caenispirillum salinarum]|uniref:S8 family peptidase n=1 Tax=Caenispirillum salinarum TaxID=859058 RepID=UPI001360B32D|nr:S8/S53 family peptidase [Caenispirillum salinarum]
MAGVLVRIRRTTFSPFSLVSFRPRTTGGHQTLRIQDDGELARISGTPGVEIERVWGNRNFTFPYVPDISAVGEVKKQANWGAEWLDVESIWRAAGRGSGIRVGIADSGADVSHPALSKARVAAFVDIDRQTGERRNTTPYDSGWHGTFCLSVLCGSEPDGMARGIAPDADMYIAKALDGWNGSVFSIQSALEWFYEEKCKIVSLSVGWPGLHDEWSDAIRALVEEGCIVFAGIGNSFGGDFPTISPANYPESLVVGVGAHDQSGTVWHRSGGDVIGWSESSVYAGMGSYVAPDCVFPGAAVVGPSPDRKYRIESGTSFAAPHAAGLAACLWSAFPNVEAQEILSLIGGGFEDAGKVGPDIRYGAGIFSPGKLVNRLQTK